MFGEFEMTAPTDDLYPRLWEAEMMENNLAKCAMLEELVRLADTRQDDEVGFEARMALVDAGTFSGAPDKALVAFSWCLAHADKHPDQYSEYNLLWKYKWVTDSLADFPQIKKKQIDDMLDDMRARYEKMGSGIYPVLMLRWKMAMRMGDKAGARKWHAQMAKTPRDFLSDCPACVKNQEVHYATFLGKDETALEIAEPILAGRMRCSEVPHITYGYLLVPLIRLKRLEEAAKMHQTGYRLAAKSTNLLRTIAEHILFLAMTDNLARGVKLFEKHLPWYLDSTDYLARFDFLCSCQFLMERLEKAETTSLKARLPKTFSLYQEKGRYDVAELAAWLGEQAAELGQRFDERNGTDHFVRRQKGMKKLHGLATPYPL